MTTKILILQKENKFYVGNVDVDTVLENVNGIADMKLKDVQEFTAFNEAMGYAEEMEFEMDDEDAKITFHNLDRAPDDVEETIMDKL